MQQIVVRDVHQCTIIYLSGLIFYSQRDMHLFVLFHTFELCEYLKNNSQNIVKLSCFENLDARNIMVQLEFNLDIFSEGFVDFFQTCFHVEDVIILSFLHAYTYHSLFVCKYLNLTS